MRPRKSVSVSSIVGSPEEDVLESRPSLRIRIVGVVVLILFGVLVLRLWTLQVVEGKTYAAAVTRNEVRVVSVPSPRGEIVDRNDTVLVSNVPQEEILLSRAEVAQNPSIVGQVAALVGQTPAQVEASVTNNQYSPYEPVPVALGVTASTVQYLQTHQSEYPGVTAETVAQRTYPQGGTTGTQILGYVGDITSAYLAKHPNQGYTQGSQIGVAGIEAQYESYLRGVAGRQALSVDAQGNVVGTLSTTAPQIGDTVVLNLDTGLQQWVEQELQQQIAADRNTFDGIDQRYPAATTGAAIVLNPQNGQVLALASYPSYDLNEWIGGISNSNFTALQASGAENNYAIGGLYTPGSTFKLVTATAALQDGIWTPGQYYNDSGSFKIPGCPAPGVQSTQGCILHDNPGDGTGDYNISGALTVSSDAFFYNLGDLFYNDRGTITVRTPIQNEGAQYGEGTITGVDLPGEAQGRIDSQTGADRSCTRRRRRLSRSTSWYTGDNIEMAFGQGADRAHADRAGHRVLHVRKRRYALCTAGGVGGREPDDGQGRQEVRAERDRARGDLADELLGHPPRARGRHLEPERHRVRRLRRVPVLVEPGRQDRHRVEPGEPGAEQLVRGVRAEPEPAVPRAGGDRARRIRRVGRGPARAQHLRLHRGPPA